jgi:DNA-binding transcriptional LysR family regulator
MNLDPKSLELFAAVVEHGSIARAAEHHHIAAAAVSKRISELEHQLGTTLLARTNKGVQATPAGYALLGHAHRLRRDVEEILVDMRDWADGARGQVRVCANISAITQFLPREIAAFLARYPDVQVHLQERISSTIVKEVLANEADIGIGVVQGTVDGLELYPYRRDELVVITPAKHPLARRRRTAFAETLAFDFVGLHTGSVINLQLARASMDAGQPLRVRIQVTSYDALSRMVEAGLGIGVMPARVAAQYSASLGIRSIALTDAWSHRELSLCVRAYSALSPSARLLVDSLRSH